MATALDMIAAIERELQRLRDLVEAGAPIGKPLAIPDDLISVESAATLARVKPDTVRKWARAHPFGRPGGFGVTIGSRWWFSRAPFLEFVRRKQK